MSKNPNIEAAAHRVLSENGVLQPPVNVMEIAENHGIQVLFEEMEDSISGFLIQREGAVPVIGVNALHHPNRQRFTMAHELAHRFLHPSTPTVYIDESMMHFRGADISEPMDQKEVEANTFAASLLMPADFIRQDVAGLRVDIADENAVRRLAQRYQVSAQALTIRLMELGLVAGFKPAR